MHDKIGLTHDNTVYMHDTTELIDTIGNDKRWSIKTNNCFKRPPQLSL